MIWLLGTISKSTCSLEDWTWKQLYSIPLLTCWVYIHQLTPLTPQFLPAAKENTKNKLALRWFELTKKMRNSSHRLLGVNGVKGLPVSALFWEINDLGEHRACQICYRFRAKSFGPKKPGGNTDLQGTSPGIFSSQGFSSMQPAHKSYVKTKLLWNIVAGGTPGRLVVS